MPRRSPLRIVLYVFVAIFLVWTLFPLALMFVWSLQTNSQMMQWPPDFTPNFKGAYGPLRNYYGILVYWFTGAGEAMGGYGSMSQFPQYAQSVPRVILNTTVIALCVVLLCLSFATLTGYALARTRFRGRSKISLLILASQFIPTVSIGIPLFFLFYRAQLLDTYAAMILAYSSFLLPYAVWILREFFKTVPFELEESALVDGCGRTGALTKILLPLSAPGLAATSVFLFLACWGELFIAMLLTASDASRTATVVVSMFVSEMDVDYGLMMAAGIVGAIPPLIIAFVFQKYLIKGLTAGAIKG